MITVVESNGSLSGAYVHGRLYTRAELVHAIAALLNVWTKASAAPADEARRLTTKLITSPAPWVAAQHFSSIVDLSVAMRFGGAGVEVHDHHALLEAAGECLDAGYRRYRRAG